MKDGVFQARAHCDCTSVKVQHCGQAVDVVVGSLRGLLLLKCVSGDLQLQYILCVGLPANGL